MTRKELDRKEIIEKLINGTIHTNEAASMLNLSRRQVLRLKAGYRKDGTAYLIHGNRNRTPVHTVDPEIKSRVIEAVKRRYEGKSYRNICALLAANEGIKLSVATVGRILGAAGIYSGVKRSLKSEKKENTGYYSGRAVMYLGQRIYPWFGETERNICMTAAVDIKSGRLLSVTASENNDEWSLLETAKKAFAENGTPEYVFCENKGMVRSKLPLSIEDELEGRTYHPTNLGEAFETLSVKTIIEPDLVLRKSAEKIWEELADYLSEEFNLRGIKHFDEVNSFPGSYLYGFNEEKAPLVDYRLLPESVDTEILFSMKEKIEVSENSLIYHKGRIYRITSREGRAAGIRTGNSVTLHRLHDKNRDIVSYRGAVFTLQELTPLARRSV